LRRLPAARIGGDARMIILTEFEIQKAIEVAFKNPDEYRDVIELIYDKILEMQLRTGREIADFARDDIPKFQVRDGVII
jgi:hypothetical protein